MSETPPFSPVRVTRQFLATPLQVFDAWLNPHTAGRWLFATPTGKMVRVEIDPREGGEFEFVEERDGAEAAHYGHYVEINRPHRLAFTFAVEKNGANSTQITIDIEPNDLGCELTLINENVPADDAARTAEDWGKILDGLAASIQDEEP
ncbi:MAG: SRPBCC family protein [Micavibrio sp.]